MAHIPDAATTASLYATSTAVMPSWLEAADLMSSLRDVALDVAMHGGTGGGISPIILTEVTNGYEVILSNWLAFMDASHADLSRVLVLSRGDSSRRVRRLVAGRGPTVFDMPGLQPPQWAIINNTRTEVKYRYAAV